MTLAPISSRNGGLQPVDGGFAFAIEDFRRIAGLVKSESGIDLPESKAMLVYSRLAKRLRALGLSTFQEYCELVEDQDDEKSRMISALTTNVTKFFREPHHFDHLRNTVIAPIAAAARKGTKVRLWSAACSTGQEPYSMALTVLSVLPEAPQLDVKILATDLNPHVLETGREGVYSASEIDPVPAQMRSRWFEPASALDEARYRIAHEARSLVSFKQLNLMNEWPMRGRFQAIFCRNVVIYFDKPTQDTLWQKLMQRLEPKGALYIGHSERVSGRAASEFRSDGITTYILENEPASWKK